MLGVGAVINPNHVGKLGKICCRQRTARERSSVMNCAKLQRILTIGADLLLRDRQCVDHLLELLVAELIPKLTEVIGRRGRRQFDLPKSGIIRT